MVQAEKVQTAQKLWASENGTSPDIQPRGDSHPIIIIPGLNRSEDDVTPLGRKIEKAGYLYVPLGIANESYETTIPALRAKAKEIFKKTGMRITSIGESFGGILGLPSALWFPEYFRPEFIGLGTVLSKNILEAVPPKLARMALERNPVGTGIWNFLSGIPRASIPPNFRLISIHGSRDHIVSEDASFDSRAEENIKTGSKHFSYVTDDDTFQEIERVLYNFQTPIDNHTLKGI